MIKCEVCDGNADTPAHVLLNCDGDFACGEACAKKYEEEKQRFFGSIGNDEAYASWWAAGGVDVKKLGDEAWRTKE